VTEKKPFNNPFAALKDKLGPLPAGPAPVEAAKPEPKGKRAVVRIERKGHGGKDATRITYLAASADDAVALAKQLKERLGCGGQSEGSDIVLQGDQRERLRALLPSIGVVRLTIG
jgi:translation initiation factor 1